MKKRSFYRPEIDGLRALAIIPVVLFHAGIAGFNGGYIGVDIFFVISGFLITSIILRELSLGSFSLTKFWERRIRRIIPAVFFITAAVLVAAYFIVLFPVDFIDFGHSLAAQGLFLANIFFMRKSSYFAAPSESMPLLHTWSLSVEEQFYIGFPILLLVVAYLAKTLYRRILIIVLALLAVLSFAYNVYLIEFLPGGAFSVPYISHVWGEATNANAGFFFLPARAWELLVGALLATGVFKLTKRWTAEVFAALGFAAIIYSIIFLGDTTPFPGYAALLPTIGCALIILANTSVATTVGQLLSFPVFVWVGLISYSLYLWHWPVIVFSKILFETKIDQYLPGIILLTFVLAWLTYKFVETPFRERKFCAKTSHMFAFGFLSLAILVGSGFAIHYYKGFPERASDASDAIATAAIDVNPRERECFRKNFNEIFSESKPCLLGDQSGTENIDFVLWGDSHGDATMPIVDSMAKEYGVTGVFFGAGGCRPIIWENEISSNVRCRELKERAVAYIQDNEIEKVLLIASWESNQQKLAIDSDQGLMGNKTELVEGTSLDGEIFSNALRETVELVSTESNSVYIMKRVPILDYSVRSEFNAAARSNEPINPVTKILEEYLADNKVENIAIDSLASDGLVTILDPAPIYCPNGICSTVLQDSIVYKNSTHINTTGAMLLRPIFRGFFESN